MAKQTEISLTADQNIIKTSIALKLMQLGFTTLSDEQSTLVYNSDNLPAIQAHIGKIDACIKKVEEEFKTGKAPHYKICKDWDQARASLLGVLNDLRAVPALKNQEISSAEEKRKRDEKIAQEQLKLQKEKIDNKVIELSNKITSCTTIEQLTSVENEVKGIKGAATLKVNNGEDKSGINQLLIDRLTAISALIATQKPLVRQEASINKEIEEAKAAGDEETLVDLMEKKEIITHEITENKHSIGNDIINITTAPTENISYPSAYVESTIKVKRKTWKAKQQEGIDISKVSSKFTKTVLDEEAIEEYLKANKSIWDKEQKEEVNVGGILFYLEKKY